MDISTARIGFVGAGNMAEAIVRGMIDSGLVASQQVKAFDCSAARTELFRSLGIGIVSGNQELVQQSDVVFLAIKPQVLDEIVTDFSAALCPGTLMVSICAGVPTARIERLVPEGVRVVRVMPNTPMLIGKGVAGVSAGSRATDDDVAMVVRIFSMAGVARQVPETDLDAVTALSGSGPAYVFRFVELLAEAGVKAGLPEDVACEFAKETVVGAAALLGQSADTPEELRRKVTSPGGTTAAAIAAFDEHGFANLIATAVNAAKQRSRELAQ